MRSCEQRTFKVESLQPSCDAIASGFMPCATRLGRQLELA